MIPLVNKKRVPSSHRVRPGGLALRFDALTITAPDRSSAKELYLKDESWSLPGHILLCFLFLHCSGSHSVGPELVASASASAGNFFESEGVRSSHPCLNKSYRRVSCTPKFQNHCPNGTTFLFDSGSDYRCFHHFLPFSYSPFLTH